MQHKSWPKRSPAPGAFHFIICAQKVMCSFFMYNTFVADLVIALEASAYSTTVTAL